MQRKIAEAREFLTMASLHVVSLMASDPKEEPRQSHESELRAAWFAIQAARESLARTVSALSPYATSAPLEDFIKAHSKAG